MTDEFRVLCAELVELCTPVDSIPQLAERLQKLNALADRARALLAQPEPEGPSDDELDELFTEIDQSGEALSWRLYARATLDRWGRPAVAPVPEPTDEALANFTAWFCRNYPGPDTLIHRPEWHAPKVFRAASDALARWGRPTPQPVAVSERLPGPVDCTTNPRTGQGQWCWGWVQHDPAPYSGRWRMIRREWLADEATHWLPAIALPTPEATNDLHS